MAEPRWEDVARHVQTEIETAQQRLERPLPPSETDIERGKLMALRSILALGVEKPKAEFQETPLY